MPTAAAIPPSLALAIKDAILIGHVAELDVVLALIEGDDDFPEELRAGLEALRHFRAHYGRNGLFPPQEDTQKKKVTLMEAAWGAELLDMLRRNEVPKEKRA